MSSRSSKYLTYNFFVLGFIFFLYLTFRIINLHDNIQFGSDAGRDFLRVWHIYTNRELTFIGPPSQYTINGKEFFFGPASYYTILPALFLGNWSPVAVSYFLIILNAAVLFTAIGLLWKHQKNKNVLYSFGILTATTPCFIMYSQSYWNPHFMLPISILLLALLIKCKISKSLLQLFFIGFLFGLGLQYHYSFIFAVLIGIVWLIKIKKLTIQTFAAILIGGIIGFLPVILFELRNNFYNFNTLFLAMTSSSPTLQSAKFNTFYFISILPFLVYLVSILLAKIKNNKVFYGILIVYAVFCFVWIVSKPKPVFSYPTLIKVAETIKQDKPTNYNIIDQLTLDNRAMALRYLLTINGIEPQGVEEYPNVQTLYIYSKQPLNDLLKNPVWEINSFLPYKSVNTIKVDDINIYKLEK